MRNKTLSISNISLNKVKQARRLSFNLNPLIKPQESTKNSEHTLISKDPLESLGIKKLIKNKSQSCKYPKETLPANDPLATNIKTLDSFTKCQAVFTEIIKKHKKYGGILQKIKEVYEKELIHDPKDKKTKKFDFDSEIVKKHAEKVKNREKNKTFVQDKKRLLNFSDNGKAEIKAIPGLGLKNVQKVEFHEEFMSNYELFSESWRKLIKK